jgi:hypothetical protein
VVLLPLAFSRPVLEELGVIHFASFIGAFRPDGSMMKAQLMRQPEYAVGLELAREHRRKGAMDHDLYKRIAGGSADIDAASNALNAGKDLNGSAVASVLAGTHYAAHLIE